MVLFIGSKEGEHANQKFTTQTKKNTTFTFLHSSEKGRKKKRKNEK